MSNTNNPLKGNLLVDITIAVEPHLVALANSATILVDAGKRLRAALEKGELFVAGVVADELTKESDLFKSHNQHLVAAAHKVYAEHGKIGTASQAAEDAMQWAHLAAMNGGKPVGQA